jgi:hypothetical protein
LLASQLDSRIIAYRNLCHAERRRLAGEIVRGIYEPRDPKRPPSPTFVSRVQGEPSLCLFTPRDRPRRLPAMIAQYEARAHYRR